MQEIKERTSREMNIIVRGIPECKTTNFDDGRAYDVNEVSNILSLMIENCPKPRRIFRLGKYNPTKDRSVKVCFESSYTAKLLLRNKNKLPKGIKIYSDKTLAQQNYMKELQNELARREANGEKDITIKFIKGQPKIVASNNSKN